MKKIPVPSSVLSSDCRLAAMISLVAVMKFRIYQIKERVYQIIPLLRVRECYLKISSKMKTARWTFEMDFGAVRDYCTRPNSGFPVSDGNYSLGLFPQSVALIELYGDAYYNFTHLRHVSHIRRHFPSTFQQNLPFHLPLTHSVGIGVILVQV